MTAQTTTAPAGSAVSEARVSRFLAQVFLVMAVGLLVTALVAGQACGASITMSGPAGRSGTRGATPMETSAPSIECTDSCPFRDLCEDYMRDISGGRAWCTLFHEFST